MATMASVTPCVVNKHVAAHVTNDTLTFLYEVKDGACDESYGVQVAGMAKFPGNVIESSKRRAEHLENDMEVQPSKARKTEVDALFTAPDFESFKRNLVAALPNLTAVC